MGYAGMHAWVGIKHVNCMLITVYEGQCEQANMPINTGLQASLFCHRNTIGSQVVTTSVMLCCSTCVSSTDGTGLLSDGMP